MNIRLGKVSLPSKFPLAVSKFPGIKKSLSDGADVAVGPKYRLLTQQVWVVLLIFCSSALGDRHQNE